MNGMANHRRHPTSLRAAGAPERWGNKMKRRLLVFVGILFVALLIGLVLNLWGLVQFLSTILIATALWQIYEAINRAVGKRGRFYLAAVVVVVCIVANLLKIPFPRKTTEVIAEGVTFGLIYIWVARSAEDTAKKPQQTVGTSSS